MTKEEIMEAIENMTVLELSELVKDMEEVRRQRSSSGCCRCCWRRCWRSWR